MLLAGDGGGTKTLMGLFARGTGRPDGVHVRSYHTLDFPDLTTLSHAFLRDVGAVAADIEAASFGVAGPVTGTRAWLTNVPWVVDVEVIRRDLPVPRAHLLNDLEAMAWAIPVLTHDELAVLHAGHGDSTDNAALIAAGTGLGIALLPNIHGQLMPRASEGGHADFAARTADEQTLQNALTREYGRAEIERVVSGPGLAHIHRLLYPHQCATLSPAPAPDDLPAAISRAALEAGCPSCTKALEAPPPATWPSPPSQPAASIWAEASHRKSSPRCAGRPLPRRFSPRRRWTR